MEPRAAVLDPAGAHRARGGVQVVPGPAVQDPPRVHAPGGAQVVPGAAVLRPSEHHGAAGAQVVPGAVDLAPPGLHGGGGVEVVPAPIDDLPAGDGVALGVAPVPHASDGEPAGQVLAVGPEAPSAAVVVPSALGEPERLGYARGVGHGEGLDESGFAQPRRVGGGGEEGVLDDDAREVGQARVPADRVVVAGGAVGVVVVGVVAGLDAAVGQAQGCELVLDRGGQCGPLGVGGVVVGAGVGVPDLGATGSGRAGVEVEGDESAGPRGHGGGDARAEVLADVLRGARVVLAGHVDPHALVGLEFCFEGAADGEREVLLNEPVGAGARVGSAVPGVEGDGDAVRGARLGRQWCDHGADGEREAYREGFPQGAHISPSCCV